MLRLHTLSIGFLLPFALQAAAVDLNDISTRYEDCIRTNPQKLSAAAVCAEGASESAKKEMNRVYQRLYLKLQQTSQEDAQQLENAQKAWLIYRNEHCDMLGKYDGSPMYTICPMKLNIDRVAELQLLLDSGEQGF
ncbi:lysozyme inhibitor LprI family protein [Pseudomonas sp. BLCC-B13]|uniref:lysozyme inhibitor LprI family protein n=1 Tax=Pseudomonas sp. BLCC-B13 TaxID=3025314 RepID=UPI00234E9E69|nr:lysozyme inhibitor LprI family protein [Pseudomonas sp. BLCC-B13]MDC7824739.1 lysozyme inhibitor LprI family protein [Pseudomonas sp. BLCC-B13]